MEKFEPEFLALGNYPIAGGIVLGFNQPEQLRQSLLRSDGANRCLRFREPLSFHQRRVGTLLQPTRERPPAILWFAEAKENSQDTDCHQDYQTNDSRFSHLVLSPAKA